MSPELTAILLTATLQVGGIVTLGWMIYRLGRDNRRFTSLLAKLIIQETNKVTTEFHSS